MFLFFGALKNVRIFKTTKINWDQKWMELLKEMGNE